MAYFFRNGNNFNVADSNAVDMYDKLPVGNYIVKKDPMMGTLFLQMIDGFKEIGKLYGSTTKDAARIINTYMSREASTGALLTGEKGSGKTLLAKTISIECAKIGIPTIVINEPWGGDAFNKFLQDISQECVVLFDEFEKVYSAEEQEGILTLLDGVYPSKKLFVLTCNDKWRIDSHMRNRPGRIFYSLSFEGLAPEFIVEYCNDNLNNKSETTNILKASAMFSQFNFDMLKALVEEMNRYNETAKESLRMLNAKPEYSADAEFKIEVRENGVPLDPKWVSPRVWEGNPLSFDRLWIHIDRPGKSSPNRLGGIDDEDDSPEPALICGSDEESYKEFKLRNEDMIAMFPQDNRFVYKYDEYEITLIRSAKPREFHWDAF